MYKASRIFLYCFAAFIALCGVTGIFNPHFLAEKLTLLPLTLAGTSEIRSLNGGGMLAFGVVIICGLRLKSVGYGMLLAMAIIMCGVVVGRVVSLTIDHEIAFTLPAAVGELLVAMACWVVIKSNAEIPK